MKVEVRTNANSGQGTLYSQEANLIVIDIDHLNTISISGSSIERDEFDNDGNRIKRYSLSMKDFLNLIDKA